MLTAIASDYWRGKGLFCHTIQLSYLRWPLTEFLRRMAPIVPLILIRYNKKIMKLRLFYQSSLLRQTFRYGTIVIKLIILIDRSLRFGHIYRLKITYPIMIA